MAATQKTTNHAGRLRSAIGLAVAFCALTCNAGAQANAGIGPSADGYVIIEATPAQEASLRTQIRVIQPDVLPARIVFVPQWKYFDDTRIMRLHLPTGYTSTMFTHLPSRTVYINKNRYVDDGHWIVHELGHLAANSILEEDAEKAASTFRRRLKDAPR